MNTSKLEMRLVDGLRNNNNKIEIAGIYKDTTPEIKRLIKKHKLIEFDSEGNPVDKVDGHV